jgi:hypothetical protein
MRSSRLVLAALAVLASLALRPTTPDSTHFRREVTRLRAHFDSVSSELRNRDVAELSESQRASRAALIEWLQEYRDAGRFPVNDRFPTATPIFRDSRGTLCAMAYLIDRSGRGDLVDRVAATRNTEYIPRLADDPELVVWLDSVGLSVAEAARIQPAYDPANDDVPPGVTTASIVTSGASLTSLALNFIHPSTASAWTGVVGGAAAIVAGMLYLDANAGPDLGADGGGTNGSSALGAASVAIGGAALMVGGIRLSKPRDADASNARVQIVPTIVPVADRPRVGLTVNARF